VALTVSTNGHRPAYVVRVLAEDSDLAAGLSPGELVDASRHAIAPGFNLPRGKWDFAPTPDPGSLGALIIKGLIVVRIEVGERAHLELLGEGDIISPWVGVGSDLTVRSHVGSEVVRDLQIALLNRAFAIRTASWPEIHAAVVQRLILRSRRLSLQAAINAVPRIDERLELTLWHLADRFGRMSREGVQLTLPITHEQLSEMVGARRPSVTSALRQLKGRHRLVGKTGRDWILLGDPPATYTALAQSAGVAVA
jgi:CRP/FNR family cyclic AMP-dependent transcriptional regulator